METIDAFICKALPGANPSCLHTKPTVTNAQPSIRCDIPHTHTHGAPFQPDPALEPIQHVNDSVPRRVETQKEQHAAVDRLEDPIPPNAKVNTKEKATAAADRLLKKQPSTESDKDLLEAANT